MFYVQKLTKKIVDNRKQKRQVFSQWIVVNILE